MEFATQQATAARQLLLHNKRENTASIMISNQLAGHPDPPMPAVC
jgi:hypothetical protein